MQKKTVNSRNHGLVLFGRYIGPYQVLPLWARVDLEAMAIKGCSSFPKAPALLEPHDQIKQFGGDIPVMLDTRWGRLIPLQRCSR